MWHGQTWVYDLSGSIVSTGPTELHIEVQSHDDQTALSQSRLPNEIHFRLKRNGVWLSQRNLRGQNFIKDGQLFDQRTGNMCTGARNIGVRVPISEWVLNRWDEGKIVGRCRAVLIYGEMKKNIVVFREANGDGVGEGVEERVGTWEIEQAVMDVSLEEWKTVKRTEVREIRGKDYWEGGEKVGKMVSDNEMEVIMDGRVEGRRVFLGKGTSLLYGIRTPTAQEDLVLEFSWTWGDGGVWTRRRYRGRIWVETTFGIEKKVK